jgi:hypothetical protein
MAGSITISSITLDSDNNFSIKSNTGATLFFANTTGIDVANSLPSSSITNDKIVSVANTKISGNIISSQITSVANTQITGNIASSQITSNPTLYGNVSVTGVIAVGGATPTTNGSGITFPATQSASTNANTLDDYEEGTWTPTYNSGTIVGATGTYTKIGRLVAASFQVQWTQSGTTLGRISGLPFNVATINYLSTHSREWYSTGLSIQCITSVGSAYMDLIFYNNSAAVTNGSTYGIAGTLVYHI